jgi:DNA-binding winged helix-turn-helix (wHTH) protein
MTHIVRFSYYEVDLEAGELRKRGTKIKLREQSFAVLAALLEFPGAVVKREDLRRRLWPDDVFVDFENNLNAVISRLRRALNDSSEHPRLIEPWKSATSS